MAASPYDDAAFPYKTGAKFMKNPGNFSEIPTVSVDSFDLILQLHSAFFNVNSRKFYSEFQDENAIFTCPFPKMEASFKRILNKMTWPLKRFCAE